MVIGQLTAELIGGNIPGEYAKILGSIFAESDDLPKAMASPSCVYKTLLRLDTDQDFKSSEPMLFSDSVDFAKHRIEHVRADSETLQQNVLKLRTHCEANPKHPGALSTFQMGMDWLKTLSIFKEGESLACCDEIGALPWLVGAKCKTWRWGPAAVPLPGVASLIAHVGRPDTQIWISCFQVSSLLEKGISIADLPSFLNAATGRKYVRQQCVFLMTHNSVFFCPFGWVWVPTLRTGDDARNVVDEQPASERNRPKRSKKTHSVWGGPERSSL